MPHTKTLHIKYFARLREQVKLAEESLQVSEDIQTIKQLTDFFKQRNSVWGKAFSGQQKLLCAVNQQVVKGDYILHHGDEVAFYPPVTGG